MLIISIFINLNLCNSMPYKTDICISISKMPRNKSLSPLRTISYISFFESFYINLIKKRLPTKKCNISHRSHMVNIKCFFCEKCIFMLKCRLRLQLKRMLMCLGIQQIDRSNVQTFRQKVFKSIFTHHSLFFPTFIQFIGFYVYCCWSAT